MVHALTDTGDKQFESHHEDLEHHHEELESRFERLLRLVGTIQSKLTSQKEEV